MAEPDHEQEPAHLDDGGDDVGPRRLADHPRVQQCQREVALATDRARMAMTDGEPDALQLV